MISNLRYLRFSLNQPIKSADDRYTGILKNIIRTYEYVIFSFPVRFNFPCNPIRCRLPDFDVIFITRFLKSNINYKLPQGQTTPPQKKNLGAPMHAEFPSIHNRNRYPAAQSATVPLTCSPVGLCCTVYCRHHLFSVA